MILTDVVLGENIDQTNLHQALSTAFNLDNRAVRIVGELTDFPNIGEYELVCHSQTIEGNYPVLLSIYVFGDLAKKHVDIEVALLHIVESLMVDCLVPDDSTDDPYKMVLISKTGVQRKVSVDAEQLDQKGIYSVSSK